MALQQLTWRAAGGLEVRTSDILPRPNTALVADNIDMRADGAVRPLDGHETLPLDIVGGGTLLPFHVAYREDELVAWDTSDQLYSFDETAQGWRLRDAWTACDLSLSTIAPRIGDQVNATGAAIGALYLVAWEAPNASGVAEIAYEVRDGSGATIAAGTVDTFSGSSVGDAVPIVRATATQWAILYHDSTTGNGLMRVRFVQAASPGTVTSATTLHTYTTAPTHNKHDMVARESDFIAATLDTIAATPTAVVWTFTSGGGATNTFATTAGSDHLPAIAFDAPASSSFFTLYGLLADEQTLEASRVQISGLTLIDSNTVLLDATETFSALVAVSRDEDLDLVLAGSDPTATLDWTRYVAVTSVDVSGTPSFTAEDPIHNAAVSHKPFVLRNRVFGPILAQAEVIQGTDTTEKPQTAEAYLIYDLDRREVAARFRANGQAARSTDRSVWPPVDIDGSSVTTVASHATQLPATIATIGTTFFRDEAITFVSLDFAQRVRPTAKAQGLLTMASGGFVRAYDGRDIFELDWHTLPVASVTPVGTGSAFTPGTYNWAFYWRWEDTRGQLHQSAPVLVTRTITNQDQVEILVYGAPHSGRTRVQIGIARTAPNDVLSYFEMLDFSTAWDAVPGGTVSFTDVDASIISNAQYEQAGSPSVKPHQATPAARFITAEGDRLWWGDPETPEVVHFSIPFRDGFAPGIVPDTSQVIGLVGGPPVNAVAELDGSYFAIGDTSIVLWAGDGPDGFVSSFAPISGGGFSRPQIQPSTLGVSSQLLVQRTFQGIAYLTNRGMRLLGRDQASAAPFAALDELYLHEGATGSRVLYLPAREETIVFSSDPVVKPGPVAHPPRTARFAHATGRWSTESNAQATGAEVSDSGDVVFVSTAAAICRYTPGVFTRAGSIPFNVICTNWLTLPGAIDFDATKVILRGRFLSDFDALFVGLGYDFNDPIEDAISIDPNPATPINARQPLADAETPPAWLQPNLGYLAQPRVGTASAPTRFTSLEYSFGANPRAHAIRVFVWGVSSGAQTGEPFALSEIAVVVEPVGPEPGNLSDAQTA